VLVVGGGDSALEAAIALAAEPDIRVGLSYRGDAFARVKAKNRQRVDEQAAAGRIELMLESQVLSIQQKTVTLKRKGAQHDVPNDAVIVCAGGVLPKPLLQQVGIEFETKYGTA
jgi:thioredoxin reductase